MSTTKNIALLATALATGALTESAIEDEFGSGVLSTVLAYTGGSVGAGLATAVVSGVLDTNIGRGVTSTVDDVVGGFFDLF
jgi:hypothetical protein